MGNGMGRTQMHATCRGASFINPFLRHPPAVLYFIDASLAIVSSFSHLFFLPVQSTAGYQIENKWSALSIHALSPRMDYD